MFFQGAHAIPDRPLDLALSFLGWPQAVRNATFLLLPPFSHSLHVSCSPPVHLAPRTSLRPFQYSVARAGTRRPLPTKLTVGTREPRLTQFRGGRRLCLEREDAPEAPPVLDYRRGGGGWLTASDPTGGARSQRIVLRDLRGSRRRGPRVRMPRLVRVDPPATRPLPAVSL